MDYTTNYANQLQEVQGKMGVLDVREPSLRESLRRQRTNAELQILRVDKLLALLDANPDTEQILQLLGMNTRG